MIKQKKKNEHTRLPRFFHATLSFPENQNPLLPQNQNPRTQNLDAAGVIEKAMSNPKTLT